MSDFQKEITLKSNEARANDDTELGNTSNDGNISSNQLREGQITDLHSQERNVRNFFINLYSLQPPLSNLLLHKITHLQLSKKKSKLF